MNINGLNKTRNFECGLIFQSLRNKAKLRQQDIATMIGVGLSTIQYWESGTTYPKPEALKKLFRVYVRYNLFSRGQELKEAEALWEKVRQEAPRFNEPFDYEWFQEILLDVTGSQQTKPGQSPSVNPTLNNLPERLTSFIGRKKELTLLSKWLQPAGEVSPASVSTRLVTLTGAGGCGKTSLALEAVREILSSYRHGVWLVELSSLRTASELIQTLVTQLGLQEQPGSTLLTILTNCLREKQILLVFDNCEHLVEECARLVGSLLQNCPGLVVVATSREILKVKGENVFRVPSLTLPPYSPANSFLHRSSGGSSGLAGELLEYEAIQLFVERGRNASPGFELNEQNKEAIIDLCQRLDGIPLAIELAAARLRVLNAFQLSERLTDRFRLLRRGTDRTVLPRHQTLRATVEWSYELLGAAEQLLFRRLSVFAGGWTMEAAEEICAFSGLLQQEILDLLQELVNKSLVTVEETLNTGQPQFSSQLRFRLLETLREFGQEQLNHLLKNEVDSSTGNSETQELKTRHLQYYTAIAKQYTQPNGVNVPEDKRLKTKLLELEYPNIRAALSWVIGRENPNLPNQTVVSAMELACAISELWATRSSLHEAIEHLNQLKIKAVAAGLDNTSHYGWLCDWLGRFLEETGNYKEAENILRETLALFVKLDNKYGIMRENNSLGWTLQLLGQGIEAYKFLRLSLDMAIELGDAFYIARNLHFLGRTCVGLGKYEQARQYLNEGLIKAREYGETTAIAWCLMSLSTLSRLKGENEIANTYLQESLPLLREAGNKLLLSSTLISLGVMAYNQKDYIQSIYFYEEGLTIQKEIGAKANIAMSLGNLGLSYAQLGDYTKALNYESEALALRQEVGDRLGVAISLSNLADFEMFLGKYESAAKKLQESIPLYLELGDKHYLVGTLITVAQLNEFIFNYLKEKDGDVNGTKGKGVANRYVERAVQVAGVITNLLETMGEKLIVEEQKKLEHICEMGQNQLGKVNFKLLFAQGQAMSLEDAVPLVLTREADYTEIK